MMKLFRKKDKEINLNSICNGEIIEITEVSDKTFASKLLGDGMGFKIDDNRIYAPCDAIVVMIANTNHAIGIQTNNGAEILIHVGMDTVNLNGKGLFPKVTVGEKIKQGQCILEIDTAIMKENKIDLTTPLIITSQDQYSLDVLVKSGKVDVDDVVAVVKKI